MTKERVPLTYEEALYRTFGRLGGCKGAAEAIGVPERTLYDWSQPDNDRGVPIQFAEKLDLAYVAAGGEGRPFLDLMTVRQKLATESEFGGQLAVAERTASFVKEAGDAGAALLRASLPSASRADRLAAKKESLEAIAAANHALSAVEALEAAIRPPDTS